MGLEQLNRNKNPKRTREKEILFIFIGKKLYITLLNFDKVFTLQVKRPFGKSKRERAYVLSQDIILSLYTAEYTNSILPLQILLAGLVFSYMSFPIGAFLNACNRQSTQTLIVFIVMVVNIILNLILIPKIGVVGASISALVGNVCLTVFGYIILPRIVKISHWFLFKSLVQIFASAVVMGIGVYFINQISHYTIAILTGVVIYPVMLFATRAITAGQVREAMQLVKK